MARVIEILQSEEKTVVHKDCGAKIGYYNNELKSYVKYDYGGGSDTISYIVCPHCGENVIVSRY